MVSEVIVFYSFWGVKIAKLYNSPTEAIALRSLCSKDTKISGLMLSRLGSDYFHTDEGKEAFQRIQLHFGKKGEPPAFKLLCEDVALSEDTREFLRNADGLAKSTNQAEQVVDQLNKFRQTRLYYSLAKKMLKRLEQPKFDSDDMQELLGKYTSRIQLRRASEAEVIHIGKDSNVQAMLEQILYEEDTDHCIPTGFSTFDSVNGGFFRGSLVTLGLTSGGGKCTTLKTRFQLSTLVIQLENGETLEVEPEEYLVIKTLSGYRLKQASQLSEVDEIETDPLLLMEYILQIKSLP